MPAACTRTSTSPAPGTGSGRSATRTCPSPMTAARMAGQSKRARFALPAPARGNGPVMTEFKKGDRVEWSSHGGKGVGEVLEKITSDTHAGGRRVRASNDEPQYLVKSEKSGGTAVHKPSALTRRS